MGGMMLNMIRGQMEKQSFLNDVCKDVAAKNQNHGWAEEVTSRMVRQY